MALTIDRKISTKFGDTMSSKFIGHLSSQTEKNTQFAPSLEKTSLSLGMSAKKGTSGGGAIYGVFGLTLN